MTGDEVYGQGPVLRGWLAERQLSYVPTIGCGPRGQNARTISAILPKDAWEIRSAGNSAHGLREYAWVMVPLTGDHSDFENALLIRRSLASSERAYYCSRSCCDRLWGRSLSRVWVGTSRLMRCVAGQPGWMLCMPGSAGISAGRSHTNGREYLRGLLAPLERGDGWTLAEQAGEVCPDATGQLSFFVGPDGADGTPAGRVPRPHQVHRTRTLRGAER
ncbi:hypothetical protein ACFQWA_20380 [Streptomyces thermogriseus]|uniref:hypothetical protein n=1 Tax=Streptomyces thermogriseus TaxID=75292 RepID=UPI003622297A